MSDLLVENLSWGGAGHALLALLVVRWAWEYTVWVTSEVDTNETPVRLLLLAMMLASFAMAVAVPEAFGRHGPLFAAPTSRSRSAVFSVARFIAFALAFVGTAAMWWLYFDGFGRIARWRLEFAANPVQLARDAYMYTPRRSRRRGAPRGGR